MAKAPAKKTTKKTIGKTAAKASVKTAAKKTAAPKKTAASKKPASPTKYKIAVGDSVRAFDLPATSGKSVSLAALKGKKVVLYFYPKDNTPGCTLEGHDFKRLYSSFQKAGAEVIGVSKDSLKSHENFKTKCGFPFELISDENETLCRIFDVIQLKKLYGREFQGIERSTFVVDGSGQLAQAWRKVKVNGHAQEVLEFVKSMG